MGQKKPQVGTVTWVDLTVQNAESLRDFYKAVVGWDTSDVEMGGHKDYCMNIPDSKEAVAGVCHAKGVNADLPPVWLIYITVSDLQESIKQCYGRGGKTLTDIKDMGSGKYCVIQDPAGAVAALFEPAKLDETKS